MSACVFDTSGWQTRESYFSSVTSHLPAVWVVGARGQIYSCTQDTSVRAAPLILTASACPPATAYISRSDAAAAACCSTNAKPNKWL